MIKLLLTGGTGFLGRAIVPSLRRWSRVTTLGRSPEADVCADLAAGVPQLPERYDVVVHAAALAHGERSEARFPEAWNNINVDGTDNLCRALEESGLPQALVFVSTVSVYGRTSGCDIDESAVLTADGYYAASKIEAERRLTLWATETGVRLTILRPALIVGPDAPGNMGMMERGIKSGRYFAVGGGRACRSMVAAPDVADAIELSWRRGGVYNLCHPEPVCLADLGRELARVYHVREPLSLPEWLARAVGRIGDMSGSHLSIDSRKIDKLLSTLTFSSDKAMRELGWKPRHVLRWIPEGFPGR